MERRKRFVWIGIALALAGWVVWAAEVAEPQSTAPAGNDEIALPAGDLDTAAICRLIPQCDSHDDCDAFCANGGRCVHSRCPIRVCRCD